MDDMTRFENRFEERLRSFARTGVQSVDSAAVARAVAAAHPRSAATRPTLGRLGNDGARPRVGFGPWRTRSKVRSALSATAVIAVLALGGALLAIQLSLPDVGRPSPTPSTHPSASLPGVVAPSPTPSETTPAASVFPRQEGVWIPTGTMGTPRFGHSAVRLLDGRVLVVGGYPGDEPDLLVTSAELYDPETGMWSTTGSMLKPHGGYVGGFGATLLRDGRVLVGDVDDPAADNPVRGAEIYDPATGSWTATGKMATPQARSATLLRDGTVLVVHAGGISELYDPDRGTWTATGQMLVPFHYTFLPVLLPDGNVLVAGGSDGMTEWGDSAELYDPESGTWTAIANMNGPKEVISATMLRDRTVLVMGNGWIVPMPPELYDPATGAWTVVGEAVDCCRSATLLPDGMVLIAGRGDSLDAELYNPGTRSWNTTGSMLQPHSTAPATLLLDGTVLVAGGESGSAELYVPAGVTPPSGLPTSPPPAQIPAPTPSPIPTAVPTPFPPAAGPVPTGARSWTVRVVNGSSKPANLFVAEEPETGVMGRLVGSVTPNVVPPMTTVNVTFLLPAKGVEGWGIFVTPIPGISAFLWGTEVPLTGEIRIGADGSAGWRSIP